MNERERVAELINNYVNDYWQWGLSISDEPEEKPDIDKVTYRIEELYSEREKAMREALEWACENKCNYDTEYDYSCCTICPIKQALEGK